MIDKFVEESLIPHNGSTKKTSMQHIQGVRLRQMAIKINLNKNHYKQTWNSIPEIFGQQHDEEGSSVLSDVF